MKHIRPYLDEAAARQRLCGKRRGLLGAVFSGRSNGAGASNARVELVFLPFYILTLRAQTRTGPGEFAVSVESRSGTFALFRMEEAFDDGPPPGEVFSPRMPPSEAEAIGKRKLIETLLKLRGRKPLSLDVEVMRNDVVHYPFWVYYFERRRGYLDIKVLDAAVGDYPGSKIKIAILEAFLEAAGSTRRLQ